LLQIGDVGKLVTPGDCKSSASGTVGSTPTVSTNYKINIIMKKYIALGDSLTAQLGYVDHLQRTHALDILNLAVGAGSNYLQCHRLRNCLFTGEVGADTTLIWQIGPLQRYHEVKDKSTVEKYCKGTPFEFQFNWVPVELNLLNKNKVAVLGQSDYFRSRDIPDFENSIQDLVSEIFLWSNVVKRIILFTGWTRVIDIEAFLLAKSFLQQCSNVEFIDYENSITDWCLRNNAPIDDTYHPGQDGYVAWSKEVLIPRLEII
jgi:hypothetical protein